MANQRFIAFWTDDRSIRQRPSASYLQAEVDSCGPGGYIYGVGEARWGRVVLVNGLGTFELVEQFTFASTTLDPLAKQLLLQ